MDSETKDPQSLRRYLLGEGAEEEKERLDDWLVSEPAALDELNAAEDDLIDDALDRNLSRSDMRKFRNHFLAASERQQKFEFARSFHDYVRADRVRRGPIRQYLEYFFFQSRWRHATPVLVVLLLALTISSTRRVSQLETQIALERLQQELTAREAASQREAELQNRAPSSPTLSSTAIRTPSITAPATLTLLPGILRDPGDIPSLPIREGGMVILQLTLVDDLFNRYEAQVIRSDGNGSQSHRHTNLVSRITNGVKVITVVLASDQASAGDYSVRLNGVPDAGPTEAIATYYFKAVAAPIRALK